MGMYLYIQQRIALWHFKDLHYVYVYIYLHLCMYFSFSQGLSLRLTLQFTSELKQQLQNSKSFFDRNCNLKETWAQRSVTQLKNHCYLILVLDCVIVPKYCESLTAVFHSCWRCGQEFHLSNDHIVFLLYFLQNPWSSVQTVLVNSLNSVRVLIAFNSSRPCGLEHQSAPRKGHGFFFKRIQSICYTWYPHCKFS